MNVIFILLVLILAGVSFYIFSLRKDPVEIAIALAREGNYLDARGILRSKLEKQPDNPKLHYAMALTYQMEGDEDNYIQHLLELYRMRKTVPQLSFFEILNKIADYYYRQDNYVEAIRYYEESLRFYKNNVEALARLAFLYAGQEMFEKADLYFQRLTGIAPNNTEFLLGRGIVCSILNRKEAIEIFQTVLKNDPENIPALLFLGIEYYRKRINDENFIERLEKAISNLDTPELRYIFHKLLMGLYYRVKNFRKGIQHANTALQLLLKEGFFKEEYYMRIATAILSILGMDLENAHEHLFILESRDLNDPTVTKLADYRLQVEEGVIQPGDVSPAGFDFQHFANTWMDKLFTLDFVYSISNLKMGIKIDPGALGENTRDSLKNFDKKIDYESYINQFVSLGKQQFQEICSKIVSYMGYEMIKPLAPDDNEGFDCLAQNIEGKKAVFKIRQWKNQSISDIYIRNFQNKLNELKAQEGFLISAGRLTQGAEQTVQNLKRIKVFTPEEFGYLLSRIQSHFLKQ